MKYRSQPSCTRTVSVQWRLRLLTLDGIRIVAGQVGPGALPRWRRRAITARRLFDALLVDVGRVERPAVPRGHGLVLRMVQLSATCAALIPKRAVRSPAFEKRTEVFALAVRILGKWGSNRSKCRLRGNRPLT